VVLKTVDLDMGNTLADVGLTERGRRLVAAWLEGDEEKYRKSLVPGQAGT
jgi:hypothetical protein